MIGRVLGAITLILLASCAGMQSRAIMQSCTERVQTDSDLAPIRAKIELWRTAMSGAPPPAMLGDQSRPSPEERIAIEKWNSIREACVQELLSLRPNLESLRQANERMGLLVAALYDGRLTYGQFAAERMKISDQMFAALKGQPLSAAPEQQYFAVSPPLPTTSEDEITLEREGAGYLVPVSVNGLPPMNFRLDTGADIVALPAEVVFTLLRTGTLQSSDFIGHTSLVMADGRELPSFKFRIRELRLGQHLIPNVVGTANLALTDPLLGGSFLSRFASWTIDNQRNVLVLR
jgi:predicted aspartyl protease